MPPCLFVTGTDTEVGKTIASLGLIRALQRRGNRVMAFKPVAAGASAYACFEGQLLNEDAYLLQHTADFELDYASVNPFLLDEPIAPHIAARRAGLRLSVSDCVEHISKVVTRKADASTVVVVEGAGGWRVPLNDTEYFSSIAASLNASVVLVVAIRLGCLNHALLSAEAIRGDGLELAGWVANFQQDVPADAYDILNNNVDTLSSALNAPLLARIDHHPGLGGLFNDDERPALVDRLADGFSAGQSIVPDTQTTATPI